jgi:opacity protein-like surface antigen
MKRVFILIALVILLAPTAFAQHDDYKKWEFFGGYSALGFDTLAGDTDIAAVNDVLGGRNVLRGLELSVTRNFTRYWGVKGDYSVGWRNDNFSRPAGSGTVDTSVQEFLGGIQLKDNETEARIKPFGHALFGFAHQRESIDAANFTTIFGLSEFHANETSFAMAFGGGLDIRLNHKIDIRAVQIDWNIINRTEQQVGVLLVPTPHQAAGTNFVLPGTTQNNIRLSAGIVIH